VCFYFYSAFPSEIAFQRRWCAGVHIYSLLVELICTQLLDYRQCNCSGVFSLFRAIDNIAKKK